MSFLWYCVVLDIERHTSYSRVNLSCRHPNLVELKKVVTGKKLDRCATKQVCPRIFWGCLAAFLMHAGCVYLRERLCWSTCMLLCFQIGREPLDTVWPLR